MTPRLVITTGESAGVGPDIVLAAAATSWPAQLVAVGCMDSLAERNQALGLNVSLTPYTSGQSAAEHRANILPVINIPLNKPCIPGQLNPDNAGQVLAQLELATELCRAQECHAMVTAPVHKGVINDAGIPFTGHTEFLANKTNDATPVMLLTSGALKIALATTHLPLRAVPDAITPHSLEQSLRVLASGLRSFFGIAQPCIAVLGLNPHAGENGHMGSEELEVIGPVCDVLRAEGLSIKGPISADTAFSAAQRATTDAYLAMFHDQGLPVIKSEGFGEIVNVTLGLPIIRTSVDHGTALSLAGTGQAVSGSIEEAIEIAIHMASVTLG